MYAEDPKFASTVSSTDLRTHARRRIRRAVVLLVLGLGALAGVMTSTIALGVAGFCLMLFALVYAASQYKKAAGRPDLRVAGTEGKPAPRRGKQRKAPLLQRMEERFRRRFDDR